MTAVDEYLATDRDEWTQEVIRRHFDPELGSPFWLKRRERLPFNPLHITTYDELVRFGPFPAEELRTLDPADLVPRDIPRPLTGPVWDSGGTTGAPKRLFLTDRMITEREIWRRWADDMAGFAERRTWLNAMPTGPHIAGSIAPMQGRSGTALVYGIDIDPRWVKRLINAGRPGDVREYTDHLIEQITAVLETERIDYLATTPALLQLLCRQAPDMARKASGARLSGTQITPDMVREYREVLGEDFIILRRYGNTLADPGVGVGSENDGEVLPYLIAYPQTTIQIVDPDDWRRVVDYGQYGQVRMTLLGRDLFLPNVLERDEAIRWHTPGWPADNVANVRPLRTARAVPEGIY